MVTLAYLIVLSAVDWFVLVTLALGFTMIALGLYLIVEIGMKPEE
jgi:hypothetical protein